MGMKVVADSSDLGKIISEMQNYALKMFGDGSVFIEKYIERPRHIEVQVVADKYGNVVHLGERECSIQRRHQKVVEEAPSFAVSKKMRKAMSESAVRIASAAGYDSVGTVEFIYNEGKYYFLEMNTRIQVEHTITEMITEIDIVKEQIKIAAGDKLRFAQRDINLRGHAIECRICAEDPFNSFMPSPAIITDYISPGGFGVRVDSGVKAGYEISHHHDSLIAKLITWGNDRNEAMSRMHTALREYVIEGPKTTIPILWAIMRNPDFRSGNISTRFIAEHSEIFEDAKIFLALRDEKDYYDDPFLGENPPVDFIKSSLL